MASMLLDCHCHVVPDRAIQRFPEPEHPRYVTAEARVLSRLLDAHDRAGITHAIVSDSFYMESARDALPDWSSSDRARLFNDAMAELVARYPDRFLGLGCIDPWGGEASAREIERLTSDLGLVGVLVNPSDSLDYLDAPRAEPFLAAAAALNVPMLL